SLLWIYLTYVIGVIVTLVIILSLFGISTGVRERAAQLLLVVFAWAAQKRAKGAADHHLIQRRWTNSVDRKLHQSDYETDQEGETEPHPKKNTVSTIVNDSMEIMLAGVESIIEDEVTSRFKAAALPSWNLLSRSRTGYGHINWKLLALWGAGVGFRYVVLLPVRFILFSISLLLLLFNSLWIGLIPNENIRIICNKYSMLTFSRILSRAFSSIIVFHDKQNRPKSGIVVANHTSPIDVMILSTDNVYAMIGQRQGGILGLVQTAVSRSAHHIWFDRTEARDRNTVRRTLKEHVEDPRKLPILIFPEGTCINNTSVMMFKKGSFEVADWVHPIAMKYDNRLGDAFWNSSAQGYFAYLMSMMTSWALMCQVWYMPAMKREPGEDAAVFARRVKRAIAQQGGLVDLEWDGNLKRTMVPDKLKNAQKELFYQYLHRTTSIA
ncbi:UNVERIFIED_CONTAM: Glycerol-3-phosphate acyltransferase 4, partial [Eudyptes robustus]